VPFNWALTWEILPLLLEATGVTVVVTVSSFALAVIVGLPLLLARRSPRALIARPVGFMVEFVRSTPLLVQLYFLFFVLPDWGVVLSPIQTGIVGMAIHYSCYMSEVYRSGLEAIAPGQWDAITSLGFSRVDAYRHVILPQVIPPIVPAAGNFLVFMFKDSPLLASIGAVEMMFVASKIGAERFQYLEPITICGAIFLALSLVSAVGIRRVEARLGRQWLGKDRREF
jgi:polar amino acid transport system permease protein